MLPVLKGEDSCCVQPGMRHPIDPPIVRGFAGLAKDHARAFETDIERPMSATCAGSRILVVDDEPVNPEIARMLLVDTAQDGAAAVTLAQETRYAAIFMDMPMPNVDGLEATRQIRGIPGQRQTPIIAMTANAFDEDKTRCFEAGMKEFLTKPFNPESTSRRPVRFGV